MMARSVTILLLGRAEDTREARPVPGRARFRSTTAVAQPPLLVKALRLLLEGLEADWSLDGLTTLVYGVPKTQAGLPLDVKPTPELKAAQRQFFVLLYRLLVGSETGPRLPTLLLAAGPEAVRRQVASPRE